MIKQFKALHGSKRYTDKLTLERFDLKSLTGDTRQYGKYCLFVDGDDNHPMYELLRKKATQYALRYADRGYVYDLMITVDTNKLIDTTSKITIQKFIQLYDIFGLSDEKLIDLYAAYPNNREIFYNLCYALLSKKNSLFCSDYLINKGYQGFIDGTDFGTIVLFDTSCIVINDVTEVYK